MKPEEISKQLGELASAVGQKEVLLRCECENLETVYILADPSGSILVTDNHASFAYLSKGTDNSYAPLEGINLDSIRRICDKYSVVLSPAPEDGFPAIECIPKQGETVKLAVERVADAIDEVFNFVRKP